MTPQEKATELIKKFRGHSHSDWHPQTGFDQQQGNQNAIECAIIAVEEILFALNVPPVQNDSMLWKSQDEWWRKVWHELEIKQQF